MTDNQRFLSVILQRTSAAIQIGFTLSRNVSLANVTDTGACPGGYLSTIGACSIFCTARVWCIYFIYGPCDQPPPNICRCMACNTKPPLSDADDGELILGESRMGWAGAAKRLVDEEDTRGAVITSWSSVSNNCISATGNIVTTLSPWPVHIFSVIGTAENDTFYAMPVCRDNFVARGVTYCRLEEGNWHDQNLLACFATDCYQDKLDKRYYAGTEAVTIGGRPCMNWTHNGNVGNHFLTYTYHFDNFDIEQAENYCRTFLDYPYENVWCYNGNYAVDGDFLRWEDCSMPMCPEIY